MCGIVAVAGGNPSIVERLPAALATMAHRGPDASGVWVSGESDVVLGNNRLAIVDLSESGNQPLTNEDGSIHLICNGEIYNYPDLRKRLEGLGHSFSSNSDSEVIIHGYEEWGKEGIDELEGMFAFALWDERRCELLAARDGIGIKPLFYTLSKGTLIIASEISAILPLLVQRPEVSETGLAYLLAVCHVPPPFSIWEGINKLEPGHWLSWNREQSIRIEEFWAPPTELDESGDYSEESWASLFEEVLRDHMLSDVPIGLFLSGGLDSSAIAAGLAQSSKGLTALTLGFPESHLDESNSARMTADFFGIEHVLSEIGIDDFDIAITNAAHKCDEPVLFSSLLAVDAIARKASGYFKTVLSGVGGDECFGGGYAWQRWKTVPIPGAHLPSRLLNSASRRLGMISGRDAWPNNLKYDGTLLENYISRCCQRFSLAQLQRIMSPTMQKFSKEEMLEPFQRHYAPTLPVMRRIQRLDLMTYCSAINISLADKAGMWNSLEVRVPFLDRRIVEWTLRKPSGH